MTQCDSIIHQKEHFPSYVVLTSPTRPADAAGTPTRLGLSIQPILVLIHSHVPVEAEGPGPLPTYAFLVLPSLSHSFVPLSVPNASVYSYTKEKLGGKWKSG